MIVYHGSTLCVQNPRILTGNRMLDFGVGFYTTRSYEQAERWAKSGFTGQRRSWAPCRSMRSTMIALRRLVGSASSHKPMRSGWNSSWRTVGVQSRRTAP